MTIKLPVKIPAGHEILPVEQLQPGDQVDFWSCPHMSAHTLAEYEYAKVNYVSLETVDCIGVGFEGVDQVGYSPGTELLVKKRKVTRQALSYVGQRRE